MPALTKIEAEQLAAGYRNRFRDRLNQFLMGRAQAGIIGGAFNYSDLDGITAAIGNALRDEFQNAGWVVVVDTPTKTVTFS